MCKYLSTKIRKVSLAQIHLLRASRCQTDMLHIPQITAKTILFCQISTQKINIFCNFEIYLIKILTWFTGDVGGLYILFIVE